LIPSELRYQSEGIGRRWFLIHENWMRGGMEAGF
jgi:hypothetical protein